MKFGSLDKMKINDTKYYESNIATSSDAQGDLTRNPETVTHTSNGNDKVTPTSNRYFEQKSLSNRAIPVLALVTNLMIAKSVCGANTISTSSW